MNNTGESEWIRLWNTNVESHMALLQNKFILHNQNKTRNLWRFDLFHAEAFVIWKSFLLMKVAEKGRNVNGFWFCFGRVIWIYF